ncbi:MAG TPA: beta-galactosidase family protein [Actinospica sp.]|nr:beta-galactosidase family protein [Actinospica sp.]
MSFGVSIYHDGDRVLSGAVHYFRTQPRQWRERLALLRAMGLDTIETYVPWNLHEPRPGVYDFAGLADLDGFLRTAAGCGLRAIVRPGPYICAEWDNGGLPAWLRADREIPLRCADPSFLEPVDRWFDVLIPRLAAHQATRGGNVIMVQVENEYGSYGSDAGYLRHLADGLVRRGIDVPLVTSDGPTELMLTGGTLPDVRATLNFGSRVAESYESLRRLRPDEPEMCMEFWCGWFDHHGLDHHTRDAHDAAQTLHEILERGGSVNIYMAHGGTSFGCWPGANQDPSTGGYLPDVTSYDYDAPLTEDGRPSPKYWALREVLGKYTELPPVPHCDKPRLPSSAVRLTDRLPLLDCLDVLSTGTVESAVPPSFEELGHGRGLAVYRTRIPGSRTVPEPLRVDGLRDRAQVLVDGVPVAILERDGDTSVPLATGEVTLVVEAMGRVNYGPLLGERKGIVGAVTHGIQIQHGWRTDPVDFERIGALPWGRVGECAGPAFHRGVLVVDEPRDGFLELPAGGKGYLWINGFCLGRYWSRGPQRRLYLPWPLLHAGENEVVVLELDADELGPVLVRGEPDLGRVAEPSSPWSLSGD